LLKAGVQGLHYIKGETLLGNVERDNDGTVDGVHPTDLGYAILANEWIRVINQSGGDLEPVDLGPFTGMVGAVAN
jgi:lysophospholipase L1-like esterase